MIKGAVAREGYKKTELGWIPEDWEVKRLGELCEVYSGGTPSTAISEYYGGEILWINSGDLNKTKIFSVEGRITELGLRNSSAKIIQPETLLIALYGATAGVVAISKIEAAINQAVLAIIPRRDFVYFLLHQLIYLQDFIKRTYKQGGQANLSGELVKSCPLALPPLPEQKKIAAILSTWDEAIEKLNSYIEAKKKLKKALMQRLLTGKQRFKEFIIREDYKKTELGWIPEDWEVRRLGELGEINMCKRIFNHETTETGSIPFYKIGTFGKSPDSYISENLYNDYRKRFSFPKQGDILISATGTIGRIVVYDGKPAYFQDSNIVWINNHEILTLNKYLYYILKVIKYNTEGGTLQRLYNNILRSTPFLCPPLPEQKKIAEILSKADEEIDLLNQELEKLKTQKKGLMQKLLTGAWRVQL